MLHKMKTTSSLLSSVFILISIISCTNGANILFYFIGGTYSHKLSVWPLASSLADKGHNVTVFSSYKKQPRPHPRITDLTSDVITNFLKTFPPFDPLKTRRNEETLKFWRKGFQISLDLCREFMSKTAEDPVLQYLVHDAKFDLVINNAVVSDCGYILTHRYGAKLVISSSTVILPWYLELFGVPNEASWVPDWSAESKFPMTLIDRFTSFYLPTYYHVYRQLYFYPELEKIASEVYGRRSSVEGPYKAASMMEIEKNASLVLVQSHFSLGFARSYPPMFVDIGGMQCWERDQPLPHHIKDLLDNSQQVVLVSFGSAVDLSISNDPLKTNLASAMEKLPNFQFVLRGNASEGYPDNVFVFDWLPQHEILKHPNVVAFLSHGGLNGLAEATYSGVPVIVVPLFADQDYNAYRIEMQNVGIRLELREMTVNKIVEAIKEVTENLMYKERMAKLSRAFTQRPVDPIQLGTFWIEFVLQNDEFYMLKSGNAKLNWFRRHLLDVFLPLCAAIFAIGIALLLAIVRLVHIIKSHVHRSRVHEKIA